MIHWPALTVFTLLFAFVTVLGFVATRWHKADLDHLNEWALAGRRFGNLISWFLIGGDIYTAYTFIAVPALVYGAGAFGFFALPYTAIEYPLVFVFAPLFWTIARRRGYITYADFARDRYDSASLSLIVALTGILATMPYIALQLVGLQVVIKAMGLTGQGLTGDLPVIIAFAILAAYTYRGGLRAPALVAIVKDVLFYVTVIAAIIVIPPKLGGFAHIFASAAQGLAQRTPPAGILIQAPQYFAYATTALGSGLALFMYPHAITSILSAKSPDVIRRNMIAMPAYSLLLGVMALFGYMVIAAGLKPATPNDAVPVLMMSMFPSWFVGVAFAAIGIGALVPAAIMSIAAANLFTRNIYRVYIKRDCTALEETNVAKMVSLIVKAGALLFVLFLPTLYAINFQLVAGSWILQTFPTLIFGLFTRWFHRRALLIGWSVGMVVATAMFVAAGYKTIFALHVFGAVFPGFIGIYSFVANVLTCAVLTPIFDLAHVGRGVDRTQPSDYNEAGAAA